VLCHYKRAQALCHRDRVRDTPTLDRCVPGCGNVIRTDEHAIQLRERADFLDKRAAFTARPIGNRLRATPPACATWPTPTPRPHHRQGRHMSPAPNERERIRAGIDRLLLNDQAQHSNGALTIVALAQESQILRTSAETSASRAALPPQAIAGLPGSS
jgi:hypothetical protein